MTWKTLARPETGLMSRVPSARRILLANSKSRNFNVFQSE
jgi:hypothetical protein